ncbi:MAG: OmpA family protein [Phycisphaerae bacterium]|nr:OmpA family protein [Phycisphaerae bacterium]
MMNTFGKITLGVIVFGAMLAAGGCNDKQLIAKNRSLSNRLEEIQGEKTQLQAEKDGLASELARQKDAAQTDKTRIEELQNANDVKTKALVKLKKMYDELYNMPRGPGMLPKKLNRALKAFAQANPGIAEYDDKYGMVKLKSDLTFGLGSAVVNVDATKALAKLVKILNTNDAKGFAVYVAGHTDNVPIRRVRRKHPTNWYLSVHRAVGVQKALVRAGLAPTRIAVMGFGEYHPILPNNPGKKGNKANRRVEIWIVPAGSFLTPEAMVTTEPETLRPAGKTSEKLPAAPAAKRDSFKNL